jgi:hypothetical protein
MHGTKPRPVDTFPIPKRAAEAVQRGWLELDDVGLLALLSSRADAEGRYTTGPRHLAADPWFAHERPPTREELVEAAARLEAAGLLTIRVQRGQKPWRLSFPWWRDAQEEADGRHHGEDA